MYWNSNLEHLVDQNRSMNATRIEDPTQLVFALDHQVQLKSEANLRKYELIKAFAKEHGVAFFPAGYGIGHQVMVGAHIGSAFGLC